MHVSTEKRLSQLAAEMKASRAAIDQLTTLLHAKAAVGEAFNCATTSLVTCDSLVRLFTAEDGVSSHVSLARRCSSSAASRASGVPSGAAQPETSTTSM